MSTFPEVPETESFAFLEWARERIRSAHYVAAGSGLHPGHVLMRDAWRYVDDLADFPAIGVKGGLRMLYHMLSAEPELAVNLMAHASAADRVTANVIRQRMREAGLVPDEANMPALVAAEVIP